LSTAGDFWSFDGMLVHMQAPRPATSSRFLTILLLTGLTTALVTAGCSSEDGDDPDAGSGGDVGSGGETASGGAASGGAASGGAASGGDSGTMDYPTDSSLAGIEAFLEAESYKSAPWVGDPAPRDEELGNPHGPSLRTYFNTAAATARENQGDDAAINSMVVKETYDPDGLLIGKLVRLKTGEGTTINDWVNYCYVSDNGPYCTGSVEDDNPFYSTAEQNYCTICHGDSNFYSPLPE
jgi:hypothetical protein